MTSTQKTKNDFRRGIIMPTLITQLKSILEQYPDDGQIFKEIIQNAEDAKATKVVFLMDHKTYGIDKNKLHHPDLHKYQGPALYAYNDAKFTDRDWEGIRRLHDSIKADDPLTVGKFGLGFKSVFHMTDLPSICSGNIIGFIDPHKRFFEVSVQGQSSPERTSSYSWNFEVEEDAKDIEKLSHQFAPFIQNIFGVTKRSFRSGNFDGTMFRFPLRNKEMHSDLSTNCYDGEKVRQLLKSLEAESDIIFLFLKNIKHIEFYEQINGATTKLLEIKVPEEFVDPVKEGRQKLSNHIRANANEWYKNESLTVNYPLQTEVIGRSGQTKSTAWIVTQHFGGRTSEPATEQSIDGYLPLVGIASKHIKDTSSIDPDLDEPYGQIFCFMPLPLEQKSPTGFYFHVQGSFAVDQNRRHLKWISGDQDPSKITDKDLIWNNFLIEKLLPVCLKEHYLHLMKEHKILINKKESSEFLQKCALNVYSVLPNETIVNHHWRNFITSFNKVIIQSLELFSITTLTWQPSMPYILSARNDAITGLLKRIMLEDKIALSCLPEYLLQTVCKDSVIPLTADQVCKSYKSVQQNDVCSENGKLILLEYFLDGLKNIKKLKGVQLLPLADGTWTSFQCSTAENKIFVCNEKYSLELFPKNKFRFLCLSKVSCHIGLLTEHFNLQHVDKDIFVSILKHILKGFMSESVELSSESWFTYDWLQMIWNCLKRDFKCNLDCFMGFHLLLVSNNKVVKLTQKPSLIGISFIDTKINECFIKICKKLNIEFVETQNIDVYTHPCLWNGIILPPKIRSIVKFLLQGPMQKHFSIFERFDDNEKDYFIRSLVSEMMSEPLTKEEITFLRSLKMFKTIDDSGKKKAEFVSLNEVNVAINDYLHQAPPVPSFVKLVDLSKESSKQLAKSLSIKLLDKHCFLDEAFIPGIQHSFYNQKEIQLLMKYVCTNFKVISPNAQTTLSETHFVTKHDGTSLARPKDLFDHMDNSLINILAEDDFPGEEWKNPEFHHSLIKLGLKGSHLITKDDCIKIIKSLPNRSMDSKTYAKFLEFLNERTSLFDESFKNQVRNVNWIKFKNKKPRGYPDQLIYKGEEVTVPARIDDVVSSSFEKIVGSACLLIDCKCLNALETFFGWNKCPHLDLILEHLKNLINSFEPSKKLQVANFLIEIYDSLDKFFETELKMSMDTNIPWVWTGEKFSSSKFIVRNFPKIDTSPYVNTLPTDFQRFNNLWKSLNIAADADFIFVLKLIKEQHENTNCIDEDKVDHDLHLAIRILNHLADKDSVSLTGVIYVPIKTSKNSILLMEAIESCVYCDESWYQNGFDVEDLDDNIHLIHEKIPMKTAENLNIASCLSKLLNVEEIQSWGQKEPVTTRLQSLLKDYTDGLSVLKELVQNADDAGATEISFVFDERTNSDYRQILLDENMKDLQGPAIWCHNNAMFTEEDFINITKLGGATKECMSTKIGKFGLGFNSVYNLTEVPIFVSGNYVVFFDPHTKYLGKALTNKNSPGLRLQLEGNKRLGRLRDQFAPFNGIFGCDFNKIQKYEGTLFRFPLRTELQAKSSEICKKHYSTNEVLQLFECLKKAGADLFLFAQHLVKIHLYHIDGNSKDPHMSPVYNISRKIKEIVHDVPQVKAFSYLEAVFKTLQMQRKCNEFLLIVETNETFGKQRTNKSKIWCISWCTGVGGSYELYCQNQSWLPIGAAAVRLELSKEETWSLQEISEGKMFCFMPLPCKSTLPFYVNGYFALNTSRTHLHLKVQNDKIDERWVWNEALLADSITSSYCNLLQFLAKVNLNVYNVFPNILNWHDNLLLVESIYKKLIRDNFCVFKSIVDEQMYSFENCRILGSKLQDKNFYQAIESSIKNISTVKGVALLKIPQNIYNCLLQMDNTINFQSKVIELKEFYEEWFIPNLSIINIKDREEIIIETVIDSHLNGFVIQHACIPVTPDGENLKFVQELIEPTSIIAKLFDDEDQMFPFVSKHMNDRKNSYLQILCNFGLRMDSLTIEEIVDRCYSVEKCPDTMKDKLPVLLSLIEDCLSDSGGTLSDLIFIEKIENIKMFPIKVKPKDYPLSWKDPSSCLISCKDGYLEDKMLIAAPNNALIDEALSFKGRYSRLKNHFGLKGKVLSIESLQVLVGELNKHFNENDNFSIKDKKLKNVLESIIDEMHKEINLMIQHKIHIPKLSELRFILTNGQPSRLLTSKQCRKFIHKSLLPYMCGVDETSLSKWDLICQTMKVEDNFTVDEFVLLLSEIEKKFHALRLDKPTLSVVLDILECVSDALSKAGNDEVPQNFFLPNKEGILCLSSKLKYNDCDWSQLQSSEYCHDKISKSLAKELGIKTVRESSLSESRISYSFGQRERLVNRINRIILGYPRDESIFKEMIQNADDASASEIHFINDTRNLPDEKVFCDEWKLMQGPALCIYNDKSFALSDLDGIQKLGEGSKQNDITKTGQYGVGFNCVYHLTDAPSFLTTIKSDDGSYNENSEISGSVLAIFDPNCHFLPDVNPFNPGALYKSEIISEMFPDVYNGYLQNIEKYNIDKRGTMFRLPLRNFQSKELSEINGDIVSTKELEKLYNEFRKESHLFLLFLKSLESIHMVKVAYDSSQCPVTKVIHEVCLKFDKDVKAKKEEFMKTTKYLAEKLQRKEVRLEEIKSREILYEVKVLDSNSKDTNWILVQRFGFNNADDNESYDNESDHNASDFDESDHNASDFGESDFDESDHNASDFDESDDSKIYSEAYNKGEINLQPYGGIAYQIDNFHSYKMQKGKIFTFLPLSRTTKLPMHINGHFFLNHEDRKDLWNDQSNKTWIKWNEAVLGQIIAPAYCSLLKHLKQKEVTLEKSSNFPDILNHFYELFPTEYTKPLDVLTREVYKFIYKHKLDLFLLYKPCNDIIEWTHVHDETYFDDLDSQLKMKDAMEIKATKKKTNLLRETLHSCGLITIVGPIHLWSNFINAGIKGIKKIAPEHVMYHLSSSSLFKDLPQKLEDTPFKSVEGVIAVLEYISKENENLEEDPELANLPLLLAASNTLNKVDINYMLFDSKHREVAPHKLDQFIHPAVEPFFFKVLKQLTISNFFELLKDNFCESLFFNINYPKKLLKLDDFFCQFNQRLSGVSCWAWLKAVWKFICDVLKNTHEWNSIDSLHIIPVKMSGTAYLYPLHKRLCVLRPPEPNDDSLKMLFESFEAVGVPLLNMQLFNSLNSRNILDLFSHIFCPRNILTVLEDVHLNLKVNNIPSKEQGLEILKYLEKNVSSLSYCSNAHCILASLPFYIDINNKQTSLNIEQTFTIPPEIPAFSTATLQGSPLIFKRIVYFKEIFQFLKIKNLRADETYTLFLFNAFQYFSKESQLEHLRRIKIISESDDPHRFIERLKNFAFIEYDGCLRKASYFYDDIEIFNLMGERVYDFSGQFISPDWKKFLVKCGLVTGLSKEKFLEYAMKLSQMRFDTSKVQATMTHCLLKEANGGWANHEFLKRLKSISFLYPENIDKQLSTIYCEQHQPNYIPFENSVLQKHIRLSWTVSNILPAIFNNCKADLLRELGVKTEINSNLVACNLRNISEGFQKLISSGTKLNNSIITLIKELSDEHLSWFVSKTLDQWTLKLLQNIKCLYIDEMQALVRPNQVVIDILCENQIFPYIVKFPIFYGKHEKLLKQLGATRFITVEQCTRSLNEIKITIGDEKMDPNSTNIANLLFKKLLKLADESISDFEPLTKLFLPCEGDTLHDSTEIYCTSKYEMKETILNNLGHPVIIIDEFELLLKMPQSIRPKFLDDCLQEKIFHVGEDITLNMVQNLQRNIMHQFFLDGLNRLKNHFVDNVTKSHKSFEFKSEKLHDITFLSKESIQLHYLLNDKPIENSLKEVHHFISHDLQFNTIKVYVSPKVKKNKFLLNLSLTLAKFLDIPSARMIIKEMLNVEPEAIDDTLNDLDISFVACKVPLGIEIPIEDHYKLVQDVHFFYPKQLVAYEVDDPVDRDEDGEPKYVLVEIIKVQSSSSESSKFALEYEVNFGSSIEVISATKLYAFEVKLSNKTVILQPIDNFSNENIPEKPLTSIREVIDCLKSLLKEIWVLREDERKLAIKRLYLKYHPDKNQNDPKLYNEVFKHLTILIEKLKNGISIDDYSIDNLHQNANFETASNSNRDSAWMYFERMTRRAKQQSYSKKKRDRNPSESSKSRTLLHNTFIRNLSRKRRCDGDENLKKKCKYDPKSVELWMKQAHHDAKVAINDFNSELRSSQWRCLKYYQAIKNGIRAVCYSKDVNEIPAEGDSLKDLCSDIFDEELESLVEKVDNILINKDFLTQPTSSRTAFENITDKMAEEVSELADKILSHCDELVGASKTFTF